MSLNMELIVVTLDVSNKLKSIDCRRVQSENILDISVTFEVSKELRFKLVIVLDCINMEFIFVTFWVLKFERLIVPL